MKMKKLLGVALLLVVSFASVAPNVSAVGIPEGATIKTVDNHDVYIVKYKNGKQFKRLVLNPQVFESYGHLRWDDILIVSQSEINSFATSSLVRVDGQTDIYQLAPNGDIGNKHLLVSTDGYDLDSAYTINGVDFGNYVAGESVGSVGGLSSEISQQEDSLLKVEKCKAEAQLKLDKFKSELDKMRLEAQEIFKSWELNISDVKIQYYQCEIKEHPEWYGFSPQQIQELRDAECSYYLTQQEYLEKSYDKLKQEFEDKMQWTEKTGEQQYSSDYLECLNKVD